MVLPPYVLPPHSYLILCPAGQAQAFQIYGAVLEIKNWPTLNNDADELTLQNSKGEIIDKVAYTQLWYRDKTKQNGGFSLERKKVWSICTAIQNWAASLAPIGGSPGQVNSWANAEVSAYELNVQEWLWLRDDQIEIHFNQELAHQFLTEKSNYTFSDSNLKLKDIQFNANPHTQVRLEFTKALPRGFEIAINIQSLKACHVKLDSNLSLPSQKIVVKIYRALPIAANDLLISEILFNPKIGSNDFIEVYNRSQKILDLGDLSVANANQSVKLPQKQYILPQTYWVLTKSLSSLQQAYAVPNPKQVLEIPNLPAFTNERGQVKLKTAALLIDSFNYHQDMHYPLYRNIKGISLERSSFHQESNAIGNFKSSSSLNGGASPTYANAQEISRQLKDSVWVVHKVISPNGDGFEDEIIWNYIFPVQE